MKTVYIAGGMRNYPLFNFPAFDKAAANLRQKGWRVISPAELDRKVGFDETLEHEFTEQDLKAAAMRDVEAIILHCNAIYMLKGWETSKGAKAEKALAEWLGYEVLYEEPESILSEASRLVGGDRQEDYGHPAEDFGRTAKMWEAMLQPSVKDGVLSIEPKLVAMCMIAVKLSREAHKTKRDSFVDIAGYAHCGYLCTTD